MTTCTYSVWQVVLGPSVPFSQHRLHRLGVRRLRVLCCKIMQLAGLLEQLMPTLLHQDVILRDPHGVMSSWAARARNEFH